MSGSERGLMSHKGRKHKEDNCKFPRTCELCDFVFENKKEMKKHMLSHSYHRLEYKCEECDFYGKDDFTTEKPTVINWNVVCVKIYSQT